MTQKLKPVQSKMLYPILITVSVLVVSFLVLLNQLQKEERLRSGDELLGIAQKGLEQTITDEFSLIQLLSDLLSNDQELLLLLSDMDIEALIQRSDASFQSMNKSHLISHFYFHSTEGINLVRLHNLSKTGDKIERYTMLESLETGKPSQGVELGIMGTLTLRVVTPLILNNAIIGYLELGKELENTFSVLEQVLGINTAVFINKNFISQERWNLGYKNLPSAYNWSLLDDYVVYHASPDLQNIVINEFGKNDDLVAAEKIENYSADNSKWRILSFPLASAGGDSVGRVALWQDVTNERIQTQSMITPFFAIIVVLSLFLLYALRRKLLQLDVQISDQLETLAKSENELSNAQGVAGLGSWTYTFDTHEITYSKQLSKLCELEKSVNLNIDNFFSYLAHPDDIAILNEGYQKSKIERIPVEMQHRVFSNGNTKYIQHKLSPMLCKKGQFTGMQGTYLDITEQKLSEHRLEQASITDYLTKLPNRRGFIQQLKNSIQEADKKTESFYVTYIDLDFFKEINDIHGHGYGDELLKKLGKRLSELNEKGHYIARIGGDEFGLIHPFGNNIAKAQKYLLENINQAISIEDSSFQLSVSIGSAAYPRDGGDPETLMSRADDAMFAAKRLGKNKSMLFTQQMHDESERKAIIRESLKQIVDADSEMYLHFQPIYRAQDSDRCHFEALARWKHPTLGNISPDEFISVAEESGSILIISEFIMRQVISVIRANQERLPNGVCINVNLSPRELSQDRGALHLLLKEIEESPDIANKIAVEITESALLGESEEVIKLLEKASSAGISIALDDFGTGYSSLTYCHKYPIDIVKIDKSFIQDYATNKSSRDIVASIVFLARSFGLKVVAEGVETSEVAELLRSKVDWLQGFYFSKPKPLEQFFKEEKVSN